jgi:hypothetical protein
MRPTGASIVNSSMFPIPRRMERTRQLPGNSSHSVECFRRALRHKDLLGEELPPRAVATVRPRCDCVRSSCRGGSRSRPGRLERSLSHSCFLSICSRQKLALDRHAGYQRLARETALDSPCRDCSHTDQDDLFPDVWRSASPYTPTKLALRCRSAFANNGERRPHGRMRSVRFILIDDSQHRTPHRLRPPAQLWTYGRCAEAGDKNEQR